MKSILLLSGCFVLLMSSSCKKGKDKENIPPEKQCRITALTTLPTSGPGITYSFTYNNDKKVSQIISSESPSEVTTFTYSGNTAIIIKKTGSSITEKMVATTNSSGMLTRFEYWDPVPDTLNSYMEFEYNNTELLKLTYHSGASSSITNVSYTNGNLTNATSSGSVATFEYYTDQAFRPGDFFYVQQIFNQGKMFYVVNKNLLKSQSQGGTITNFNYTFNANNLITKLESVSSGTISAIQIQQICE